MDASSPRKRRTRVLILAPALFAGAALLALALVAAWLSPFGASVGGLSAELSPGSPVTLTMPRFGVSIVEAYLVETTRGSGGEVISDRQVPLRVIPSPRGSDLDLWSYARLERADGTELLRYDGEYRLRLTVDRLVGKIPFLAPTPESSEYQFRTFATPRLAAPQGVIGLGYQEPLELRWSGPVSQFSVEVDPPLQAPTWIDPAHPDVGYVDLSGATPGAVLRVLVKEARGTNGAPMPAPAALMVETAASPRPVAGLERMEDAVRITIPWDRPLRSLNYQIAPAVDSTLEIDGKDPRKSYLLLQEPKQQQEYRVSVTGGMATTGAPIAGLHEFTFVTPPPLEVNHRLPGNDAYGVGLRSPISVQFSEPIRDRGAAEARISLDPPIPGHFQWPEPDQVEFVPGEDMPALTTVTVRLQGGPEGVRGASGSYLETSEEFSFLTRPDKLIDVDLAAQRLTLFEGDKPVFTASVSTGVRGAETPPGSYMVDVKLPATRMRGVNPSGSRYDIPNVPWVLSFLGDYTIHGAPWRSQFGFPQSNGCVSMTTDAAKRVYDWAPVGTPVRIR